MNAFERKLISYGVGGRPLNDVPADVIQDALASDSAEIVLAKDVESLMENFSTNDLKNCFKGDISKLKNKKDYVLRIKTNEWRRLVLKSKTKRSKAFYVITSLLVTNPEGLSKTDLKKNIGRPLKKWNAWMEPLIDDNIVMCATKDGQMHYTYNFERLDDEEPERETEEKHTAVAQRQKTGAERKKSKTKLNEGTSDAVQSLDRSLYVKAFKMLKSSDDTVALDDLRQKLAIQSDMSYDLFLEELQKLFPVQLVSDAQGQKRIVLDAVAEGGMRKRMLEFGEKNKIMILSDHRPEISKINPNAFSRGDSGVVDFFEENGFIAVEIRSKYIPPEFIIHLQDISRDDDVFVEFTQKAKVKIAGLFRERIRSIFYQNPHFAVFDNGFIPELRERVRLFYAFIYDQMKCSNFQMVFDREVLLKMEFLAFASCIPLGFENLVLEIAIQHTEKSGDPQGFDLDRAKSCVRDNDFCDYGALYEQSLEALHGVTCGNVLDLGDYTRPSIAYLRSKLNIGEFDKIFSAILKYNMFEISESDSFLYFQMVGGVDDCTERIYSEIKNETNDKHSVFISRADRKTFFDKVCEFSQEEFVEKVRELLKINFAPPVRKYYSQKLRLFK